MLAIGIDPGTQGAICLLDSSTSRTWFHNTPKVKKLRESVKEIRIWLEHMQWPNAVTIEDVHSMHLMSAKSNFQFGRNLGLIEAVIYMQHWTCTITHVQPKKWQSTCEINFVYPDGSTPLEKKRIRKMTTAHRVLELYPSAAIYGPRGGLMDGRADALMIAHYTMLKYRST